MASIANKPISELSRAVPSLMEVLTRVPDHRCASGKRYRLSAILAFVCCGMLCKAQSLLAVFEWGRAHQKWCLEVFGFQKRTPCVSTLHLVMKDLDVNAFEIALQEWIKSQTPQPQQVLEIEPIAIDGKTLRGSGNRSFPAVHLLSAFASSSGMVLAQTAAECPAHERKEALPLLKQLNLKKKIVTGDALYAQREICSQILAQGGDYLFEVKKNQQSLWADIARVFQGNLHQFELEQTIDQSHGRIEIRHFYTTSALKGHSDWPGLEQVCYQKNLTKRKGQWQEEFHYKVTSLTPQKANVKALLQLSRSHWGIENRVHYVRDVTMLEDLSRVRTGWAAQGMAAIRNLLLNIIRTQGWKNVAAALRHFNWHPQQAAVVLGLCL